MHPVERIYHTFEGKPVDRVPCFCAMMESRTANEIIGEPFISEEKFANFPVNRFLLDKLPEKLTRPIARKTLVKTIKRRNLAQVRMGFDMIWAYYDDSWHYPDSKTIAFTTGSIYNMIPDGYGGMTYMYRGPGLDSTQAFDAWPYWPDTDELAHRVYAYYKKFLAENGDKTCIMAQGFFGGLQESMNWTFGIAKVPIWIKKHPDYTNRFLDIAEEINFKTHNAMIDAGAPVIIMTDDFAFKTGPFMSPKMVEDVFGERYRRLFRNIHQRGAKAVLHSCGDNTRLFDVFAGWGVDGLHAFENTSNVDIFSIKKTHGDRFTIMGGVGIDYLLTDRSKDGEIVDKVKELIGRLGPGGRFIIGPTHSEDSMPAHKLRVMLDAARKYGPYPIQAQPGIS